MCVSHYNPTKYTGQSDLKDNKIARALKLTVTHTHKEKNRFVLCSSNEDIVTAGRERENETFVTITKGWWIYRADSSSLKNKTSWWTSKQS